MRDVNAAIQVLRELIYRVKITPGAEIPTSLTDSLRGLFDELTAVQNLLPSDVSSFSAKVAWVFKKKRLIDAHLKALETRKMTLLMHLGVYGL